MKLKWLWLVLVLWGMGVADLSAQDRELIVLSGGPALRFFERGKESSHDKYWGNFIDAATIRIKELQQTPRPGDTITWLVYRPSYIIRSNELKENLLDLIVARANRLGVALLWFDTREQLINYLNTGKDRKTVPIGDFDYFGHSNKACFLFDYSCEHDGMSRVFLHSRDLVQIKATVFTPDATAKSWGCHSGEYYSEQWKKRFGVAMTGAVGKTDYSHGGLPFLSSEDGHWTE